MKSFYQPRTHPDAWSVNANCLDEPLDLTSSVRRAELGSGRNWRSAARGRDVDAGACAITAAMHRPLRLTLDRRLQANWRWLGPRGRRGGAAVKADGYGLGARETTEGWIEAGCRDFFVSTWAEAEALGKAAGGREPGGPSRRRPDDVEAALRSPARPCLNTSSRSRAGGNRARTRRAT